MNKIKAVRWMSFCEFSVLVSKGAVNAHTAPFAVIHAEDDLRDCNPPTVPVGSLMLWIDAPVFGSSFGQYQVWFEISPDEICWTGKGLYHRKDDPSYMNGEFIRWTEEWDEIAVYELRLSDVIGVHGLANCNDVYYGQYGYTIACENERNLNESHEDCVHAAVMWDMGTLPWPTTIHTAIGGMKYHKVSFGYKGEYGD